jgi:hypothetical protein
MTHHKAHQRSQQPPCCQERGSIDARFAHRVGETALLLSSEQLNGRERDFTLLLHRVLHPLLHPSRVPNLSRIEEIGDFESSTLHAAQNRVRRERPHPLPHGASRFSVGSLPPHCAARASSVWPQAVFDLDFGKRALETGPQEERTNSCQYLRRPRSS